VCEREREGGREDGERERGRERERESKDCEFMVDGGDLLR
jgi:hypothetical protein